MAATVIQTYGRSKRIKEVILRVTGNMTGSEEDTGFDLPSSSVLLLPPWVKVTTAEVTGSTKTIDVGLLSSESGGDADGFIDGISVASTGIKVPTVTITAGATESYYDGVTIGALLRAGYLTGTNTGSDFGIFSGKLFNTDSVTAKSVTITAPNAFSEFRGTIHFLLLDLGA